MDRLFYEIIYSSRFKFSLFGYIFIKDKEPEKKYQDLDYPADCSVIEIMQQDDWANFLFTTREMKCGY